MEIRNELQLLPSFSAELEEIRKNGISESLLYKIIQKHIPNATYNRRLYKRYMGYAPIHDRQPRYEEEEKPINNKINNDFFGEIIDFKTGYFSGEPISYGYADTDEAKEVTGGENAVDIATKTLTDFITRNNMYGVDMETTKFASIYGYAGRLFYIDKDGNERVMPVHGYETIILSDTDISEPEYAIRYFETTDIDNKKTWTVEFYDDTYKTTYKGDLLSLQQVEEPKEHFFDYCPLQGIANNKECLGDAEKVLTLIDDYDKIVSDNSNDLESFSNSLMLFSVDISDEQIRKAQHTGVIVIPKVGTMDVNEPVKYITKNIDDTAVQNHLNRIEDNIYRFSKTPNLGDETFNTASGVSLKFKLHGLETKCSLFEAKFMDASQYMFKVLASAWHKKSIAFDPLQVVLEFHRNFPLDRESEARTAQAYIAAGMPKKWVFANIAGVDDVEYIMELLDEETDITATYEDIAIPTTQDNDEIEINGENSSQ